MRPIGVMAGVTILICIFAAVLAYFITSGMVSSRIERLTHFMQEVQEGSMDMQMESDDRDEIGMLSLINWKALAAGEEDISRMTLALSTFYRTALNRGRNVLQVETELSNTRAYLEIQSMLHDGDFDYEIEAQTEILQCESLNLILQPLVENAIHHGIEEKTDGRGKITVRGWKEDNCVWFMVEDNGVGMSEEQCRSILHKEPGDNSGIGIKNVNDRIKIYFGKEYGLTIESELDEGTTVIIRMPKVEEKAAAGWEKV